MDLNSIEILGNEIVTLGDALSTEASILEKQINDENIENSKLEENASNLEINGEILTLLGDFILAITAEQAANLSGKPYNQATIDNLIGSWLNVAGDYFSAKASIEETEEN